MDSPDVFSARDLRLRSGDLLRDAEQGRLALVTKHGRPAFVAVPFDAALVSLGLGRSFALNLVRSRQVGTAEAAKIADMSLEDFIELLGVHGIDVVDYPPEELDDELAAALPE